MHPTRPLRAARVDSRRPALARVAADGNGTHSHPASRDSKPVVCCGPGKG